MEIFKHFLLQYPVLSKLRLKQLRSHTFYELGEMAGININRLNKFVSGSRLFADIGRSFFLRN